MNYKQAFAVGLIAPGVMAVREQWETLFEGTVTTSEETNSATNQNGFQSESQTLSSYSDVPFWSGDTIRLTVNGVSTVLAADGTYHDTGLIDLHHSFVGNSWLWESASKENPSADDGFDYFVCANWSNGGASNVQWFLCSRYEGTYAVKVERLVK